MPPRIPSSLKRFTFALAAPCLAFASSLQATTITYTDGQTDATNYFSTLVDPTTLTIAAGSATQSGAISGTGDVFKTGAGTLILTNTNPFLGNLTVNSGLLELATGGAISSAVNTLIGNSNGDDGRLLLSGGSVSGSGYGIVGSGAGSIGTVTVSSGSWTNVANLTFGFNGTGMVDLSGTGSMSNLTGFLGHSSLGTANVSGGSWTNSDTLFIGLNGTGVGVLNLTDSGVVTVGTAGSGPLILGNNVGAQGTLNLGTGGAAGTLNAGTVTGGDGTAVVNFNHTNDITIASDLAGSLVVTKLGSGTTTLTGSNTYSGGTTVDGGTLQIGDASTSSSLGDAITIHENGSLVFQNASTASNGSFQNMGSSIVVEEGPVDYGGSIVFTGTASAGTSDASFINNQSGVGGGGGSIAFQEESTAGDANFDNFAGARITFTGTASANTAYFFNDFVGSIEFSGQSTAEDAFFENSGNLRFYESAKAGAATIHHSGHYLTFADTSEANSASLISDSSILFQGLSDGGTASVTLGYNGKLDISNHTGALIIGSLVGTGSVDLGSQNLTVGSNDTTTLFSGVIQNGGDEGATGGSLTKIGVGTLTLSGENSYSGTTTVNAGALVVDHDGTTTFGTLGSGAITVNGDSGSGRGNLEFINSASTSGSITSNGTAIDGYGGYTSFWDTSTAGSSTLTSNGGTAIGGYPGATSFNNTSTAGSATLIANGGSNGGVGGIIGFNDDATGGTATVQVNGNGALIISYHNGGVTIGSLAGDGYVLLGSNTLSVGSNDDTTFSGAIADSGGLTKIGNGTLTLTNTNSYSGATTVSAGSLIVNGTISSATTVANGAALGGSGTVGTVINNGTVSPGNSPGTLTLNGNYTQNSNGTLRTELASSSSFDQLNVTGSANLAGTLQIVNSGYVLKPGIIIILNSTGLSDEFDTIINPYEALGLVTGYTDNAVILGSPFAVALANSSLTPNQSAVAIALDQSVINPNLPDLPEAAVDHLNSLNEPELQQALDQIAAEELASTASLSFALMEGDVLAWEQHLADVRRDQQHAPQGDTVPSEPRFDFFVAATGGAINQDGSSNAGGYDTQSGGSLVGADTRLSDCLTVGMSLGYARSRTDVSDGGEIEVDGVRAAGYAMYHIGAFFAEGLLGGGRNTYDSERAALGGTASGSTAGSELDAALTVGHDSRVGAFTVTPSASLLYTLVKLQGYTESGSLLPLELDSQSSHALRSRLGLRAAYTTQVDNATITPSLSAQWQHELLDNESSIDAGFANGAGSSFTVHGPQVNRDSAVLTAGVNVAWSRYSTYAAYQASLSDNYQSQRLLVGLRIDW